MWDGRGFSGELAQAAWDYPVELVVQDSVGNSGSAMETIGVDVYVLREGDRLRIQISSIYFAPFSPEFDPAKEEENSATLTRLAEVLKKYTQYKITIEGHAVRIYWYDQALGNREEREVLAPLSKQRAENVKNALIDLGVNGERLSTAGYGGLVPVVPHSDLENRWKNRRAEFILHKD